MFPKFTVYLYILFFTVTRTFAEDASNRDQVAFKCDEYYEEVILDFLFLYNLENTDGYGEFMCDLFNSKYRNIIETLAARYPNSRFALAKYGVDLPNASCFSIESPFMTLDSEKLEDATQAPCAVQPPAFVRMLEGLVSSFGVDNGETLDWRPERNNDGDRARLLKVIVATAGNSEMPDTSGVQTCMGLQYPTIEATKTLIEQHDAHVLAFVRPVKAYTLQGWNTTEVMELHYETFPTDVVEAIDALACKIPTTSIIGPPEATDALQPAPDELEDFIDGSFFSNKTFLGLLASISAILWVLYKFNERYGCLDSCFKKKTSDQNSNSTNPSANPSNNVPNDIEAGNT